MASSSPTGSKQVKYAPPPIPETPSQTINEMLRTRFGEPHTNAMKAPIAPIICGMFTAINMVYTHIQSHTGKQQHSHTMWMVACGKKTSTFLLGFVEYGKKYMCMAHVVVFSI